MLAPPTHDSLETVQHLGVVEFRPDRIGVDTGACFSGKLTALGLEGKERWVIQT
jgi:diadenosine tetraphosphatase ApaH/serine/threonine PP2A family protein phosphatase